jgi:Zn-finger nucleic acid-binding protein
MSALECGTCAGLWLADETFRQLCERARVEKEIEPETRAHGDGPDAHADPAAGRIFYRRCPVCSARMNRRNFGRRSGVILDQCRDHGTWFDASELSRALDWIRSGGEGLAEEREKEEARAVLSAARFRVEPKAPENSWTRDEDSSWSSEEGILPLLTRMLLRK